MCECIHLCICVKEIGREMRQRKQKGEKGVGIGLRDRI